MSLAIPVGQALGKVAGQVGVGDGEGTGMHGSKAWVRQRISPLKVQALPNCLGVPQTPTGSLQGVVVIVGALLRSLSQTQV